MSLTTSSTEDEMIAAYMVGANYASIAEETRLTQEEVAVIIETAEAAGKLAAAPASTKA